MTKTLPKQPGADFEQIDKFWVKKGEEKVPEQFTFIIDTPTIAERLKQLSRIVVSSKYPVLLQGPTSSGKTSLVEYLALRTGHK